MRQSRVTTNTDLAGKYETETFDCLNPKSVVICSHGNGVRRWDGEHFFYNVAEHFPDRAFLLVDQNQPYRDGCRLNSLQIMIDRVQGLIAKAVTDYPGVPIIVLGHSMGCGIAARLDLSRVNKVIFVAPAAGDTTQALIKRYGSDIIEGKTVQTTDGLTKDIPKEYVASVRGVIWEKEYEKLLTRFKSVYVFESGDEEIVGEERLQHRAMPFAEYKIMPGAKHNVVGAPLQALCQELAAFL